MQSLYIQPITYFGEDYRRLSPSDEWLFMNITAEYQTITIPFTVQAIKEDRLIRTQKKSSTMLLIELSAEREASITLSCGRRGSCPLSYYIKDAICQVSIFDALLTSFAKVVLFPDMAMVKGKINMSLTIKVSF